MKTNELRIGNKILVNKIIVTIKSINFNPVNNEFYIGIYENSSQYLVCLCNPIPLTEEILLKCGFEKQSFNMSRCYVYQKEVYRILKSFVKDCIDERYSLCIHGVSPATWSICDFEYLHQLQNLYFTLTGEELNINLKGMRLHLSL